jgi:hypothetical protein
MATIKPITKTRGLLPKNDEKIMINMIKRKIPVEMGVLLSNYKHTKISLIV